MILKRDVFLYNLFSLCDNKNCFLYEHCSLFGKELTVAEVEFWGAYNVIQNAQFFKVEYKNLTFDETIEEIERSRRKQCEGIKQMRMK